ncbi:hypothetical protein L207DRAFT_505750 [Hyaloscypha variabilis F]|uniref:Uncharacterized protein n=1 Tax=Hyaloscypha variabilis (strain UAMH 11265 / GT02V1 / F) TaxID=1149755 RepID=A0A2J6SD61_HYAVF|nr:hypothetical protein L207DRAFT_505750 [Hyaloscypha variabilis F]
MSSSKQASDPQAAENSDQDMVEIPDSPPEHVMFSPTQASQPHGTQQAGNSARANGDNNAKVNFGAPGSSWQTKKFNDEYERAENQLLDRNWDHTKYGDPLLKGA